ncbi:hypothetical protein AJ80_06955 [Polytolypa hystricis UAMH7299]|uniref:Uncharacterized protein n=1 Tax=Polytolypa hystricis (strain UAMH7299) TaxID=1447883 RepID=A0A2B7XSF2_POLH7|nr:hypothetical protein AJ80_06955 [Polytolypa hystricis UAMH7299]
MDIRWLLIITFLTSLSAARDLQALVIDAAESRNAIHIFNAIYCSMRQWGSSINHNGMSLFIATIPAGTELFHGTVSPGPVVGMDWLAFEPEHAAIFARMGFRMPIPGASMYREQPPEQVFLGSEVRTGDDGGTTKFGWFHTYVARRDLRLLYIDGMSAGKCDLGTLDSQDYLILNRTLSDPDKTVDGKRGLDLCNLVKKEWHGRIDGFVRMELGFELLFCDFQSGLGLIHATKVARRNDSFNISFPIPGSDAGDLFNLVKAATSRYNGIGGNRVTLDYEAFFTAYTYSLDLFKAGRFPRLENTSSDILSSMRRDVYDLVMAENRPAQTYNWQCVADMIVSRYATHLKILVSGRFTTLELLAEQIERILLPFMDYDDRNTAREIDRCTTYAFPAEYSECTASRAIQRVSRAICSTLTSAAKAGDHAAAVQMIRDLIEYLDWPTWKECRGCGDDEVCLTPMWPMGTAEDYEHPRCLNATQLDNRGGYWGSI